MRNSLYFQSTPEIMRAAVKGKYHPTIGIMLKNGKDEGVVNAYFNGCSETNATKEFTVAKEILSKKNETNGAKITIEDDEHQDPAPKFGPPGCFKTDDQLDSESDENDYSGGDDSEIVIEDEINSA